MDRNFSYRTDPTSGRQWGNIIIYHSYLRCTIGNCSWAASPLLFLLYINDLPDNISTSVRLFADDCILYTPIRTQKDPSLLQNDLLKLQKWQDKWLMKFNPGKCYTMTLATRTPTPNMYTFCGQTLTSVDSHCYLGIHLSNTLNWTAQTKAASTKAQQTLGVVRRNLNKCPTHIKAVAYTFLGPSNIRICLGSMGSTQSNYYKNTGKNPETGSTILHK